MACPPHESLKTAQLLIFFSFSLFTLRFYAIPVNALNIGVQSDPATKFNKECSRTCESKFCGVALFLRYGKYCGLLYTGCAGEAPCDGLDACCMTHDKCIQRKNNNYLDEECNQNFLKCLNEFDGSKAPTFEGNTCSRAEVVSVMKQVTKAAVSAGSIIP